MIRSQLSLVVLLATGACMTPKESAKSDTLPSIDTLKPTPDTVGPLGATTTGQMKAGGTTAAKAKTVGATTKAKSTIIGHDSVTPLDPRKKRLDTVKKRP